MFQKKFFRVSESSLRPMQNTLLKSGAQNFTDHAWLPHGRMVATTDIGEIVFFNECELDGEVPVAAEVGAIHSGAFSIEENFFFLFFSRTYD